MTKKPLAYSKLKPRSLASTTDCCSFRVVTACRLQVGVNRQAHFMLVDLSHLVCSRGGWGRGGAGTFLSTPHYARLTSPLLSSPPYPPHSPPLHLVAQTVEQHRGVVRPRVDAHCTLCPRCDDRGARRHDSRRPRLGEAGQGEGRLRLYKVGEYELVCAALERRLQVLGRVLQWEIHLPLWPLRTIALHSSLSSSARLELARPYA